jgi:hypothetical protein
VWITENNVNADFNAGTGMSACNPGQVFVTDKRGSSAFFAAWRPYVFSQVGKVGAQALYHWDFAADAEFGELDGSTGQTQLSYWVDYWIGQMFPVSSQQLLQFTNSDDANFEVLPVKNTDGSVVVMISNHAVASPEDNNGAGLSAKITLDVSALGNFASASLVMIDSSTSAAICDLSQFADDSEHERLQRGVHQASMIATVWASSCRTGRRLRLQRLDRFGHPVPAIQDFS